MSNCGLIRFMLNPLRFFSKPEYVFRPKQTLKRFMRIGKPVPKYAVVELPWGAMVRVQTNENVGCEIYHYGIFDKIVPEVIWRLLDHGDTAIDIGANIGQNCSLMSAKVGRAGRVLAFEPHPEIFAELKKNCTQAHQSRWASIQFENIALGEITGEATLITNEEFFTNRGSATLHAKGEQQPGINVAVRQLDEFLNFKSIAHVCKIDVEGHELGVLQGAKKSFERKAIRDIIFEDFNPQPSPVVKFLEQYGFSIFELHDTWLKPRLIPLQISKAAVRPGFSFNYLATLDGVRAKSRFRSLGWHCLLNI